MSENLETVKNSSKQDENKMSVDDDDDSDSNDSSDSSNSNGMDEDENEEAKSIKEYVEACSNISLDKMNYNLYLELIGIAHKINDLDKIREAYKLFSDAFPLSSDLWLKLIQTEQNVSTSIAELQNVEKLYRKSLNDYYSTDVAFKFAEFITTNQKLENSDKTWLEILATYALHPMEGRKFFTLFRKYNDLKSNLTENEKQINFIKSYLKELKLPLLGMEETYIDFKVFYEKNKNTIADDVVNWETIEKYYKRAKEDLESMLPFEKILLDKKIEDKSDVYKNYIFEINEFVNENIVQMVYERMVSDCCLDENCWLKYVRFMEKEEKYKKDNENSFVNSKNALQINSKALRNCIWSHKLHAQRIHLFEEKGKTKSDVQKVLEHALETGLNSADGNVYLWLEYLSYLIRNTNFSDDKECEILRKNFEFCWDTLGKQFGVLADCNCEILQLWGKLEFTQLKRPIKGKELWKTVMESSDNAVKSALWTEFIELQSQHDLDAARKLYKEALKETNPIDNPYVIASAWIRFERCYGSQKQLVGCQIFCEKIIKQHTEKFNKSFEKSFEKRKDNKRKLEPVAYEPDKKIKKKSTNTKGQPSFSEPTKKIDLIEKKQQKNEDIDFEKDHLRIFLSNLDFNITEEEVNSALVGLSVKNIDLIKSSIGKGRGFGYVELSSTEDVQKALSLDRTMLKGRPVYISNVLRNKESRPKFKYGDGNENRKVFVRGLPDDTSKDDLEKLFKPFGKLVDIRIVYHKSGKPKGIAYVEYESDSSANEATKNLNNSNFMEHTLNVAISDPPKKNIHQKSLENQFSGSDKFEVRSEQKRRMDLFVPSSVIQKKTAKANLTETSTNNGSNVVKSSKTNEDFRKLLLK